MGYIKTTICLMVSMCVAVAFGYETPDDARYSYVSTYYVEPVVSPASNTVVRFFVTDWENSLERFGDGSFLFDAHLRYTTNRVDWTELSLEDIPSGDYAGSPDNSEWPLGVCLHGDCRYVTLDGLVVSNITGYGVSNGTRAYDHTFPGSASFNGKGRYSPGCLSLADGTVTNCDIHANNGGYSHSAVNNGSGIVYLESGTLRLDFSYDDLDSPQTAEKTRRASSRRWSSTPIRIPIISTPLAS